MIVIDDKTFKIDNIIISPSKCKINKKEVETNKIEIISKECETSFIIYTLVPFSDFNTFPLNEKISIMDKIDNYDITLYIKDNFYINSEENSEIYLTRISDNIFKLDILITDFEKAVVSNGENIEKFLINAIINEN